MADKTLVCQNCGAEFIFTEGEQAFYKEKGFEQEPKRCKACRRAKKMQNNSRGGGSAGGFGGGRGYNNY